MRVHLGASFGAVTQVRLSVCVNIALPVLRCVCVCVAVFMHIQVEACTPPNTRRWVCVSPDPTVCSFQVFSRACNRVWPRRETLTMTTTFFSSFFFFFLNILEVSYNSLSVWFGEMHTKCHFADLWMVYASSGHAWRQTTHKDRFHQPAAASLSLTHTTTRLGLSKK